MRGGAWFAHVHGMYVGTCCKNMYMYLHMSMYNMYMHMCMYERCERAAARARRWSVCALIEPPCPLARAARPLCSYLI